MSSKQIFWLSAARVFYDKTRLTDLTAEKIELDEDKYLLASRLLLQEERISRNITSQWSNFIRLVSLVQNEKSVASIIKTSDDDKFNRQDFSTSRIKSSEMLSIRFRCISLTAILVPEERKC